MSDYSTEPGPGETSVRRPAPDNDASLVAANDDSRTVQDRTSKQPPPDRGGLQSLLQVATLCTALAATGIGLVGYGVSHAADRLGGTMWPLVSSPMDAFALFAQAAPRIVLATAPVIERWWDVAPRLWLETLPYGAAIASLPLAIFFVRPAVQSRKGRIYSYFSRLRSHIRSKRWASNLLKAALTLSAGATGGILVVLASVLLIQTAIFFLAALPLVGYVCGEMHIRDAVLVPEVCGPTYTRAQHLGKERARPVEVPTALCVEVRKDERVLGQGRVVFATPDKVLLYGPRSGSLMLVPTEGATVAVIEKLRDETNDDGKGTHEPNEGIETPASSTARAP